MRLSLDVIGYGGYFTLPGQQLPLEEAVRRAGKFGYDAACIYAHRPLGFPMDFNADRRRALRDLYAELDVEVGAVVCCTNFQEANHVLLYSQEKEIMYVKECIRLAQDLGSPIVRVLAAYWGYFQNPYAGTGYGFPAFEARSRRVSRGEDWLAAWHQVRMALREVALFAQEHGVTLALQTHPEITGNNDDTLQMLDEVGVPSLKVGLDLPLLESQEPDFVRQTVRRMKGLMVYSHTISMRRNRTIGGAPYSWEEVSPGSLGDPLDWELFVQAIRDIGYDGLLSAEQCSPVVTKDHRLGTIEDIDQRYIESLEYLKQVLIKHKCYTGHKDLAITKAARKEVFGG
jgi:sugar phosphate isomerase/epimerase